MGAVTQCTFCDASLGDPGEGDSIASASVYSHTAAAENPSSPAPSESRGPLRTVAPSRASQPPRSRSSSAFAVAPAADTEPEWRREVARRLHDYRVRHGRLDPDDPQSGLPFQADPTRDNEYDEEEDQSATQRVADSAQLPRARSIQRSRAIERVEILIQPEFDFASSARDRARPQTALVPLASLAQRRAAGLLDAIFLGLTFGGFLALFRSLGGQLLFERVDAIVYLATFFLFYAQYFALFTTLAGATPGMMLRGLAVVRLDGSVPDTRQLVTRSFGYLLSAATLMIGFCWALWDEDCFTWQDRISQTYITAAEPLVHAPMLDPAPPHGHRFAHK
ncbi:MAG: RDD family protein [Candidatus Acidiferrales bacterium]